MKHEVSGTYLNIPDALSLSKEEALFIASDVKQLALDARASGERFDAHAFIEKFQEKVAEGTLIIPAYTDHLKNGESFDHRKGKPTTGALSNKAMRRKDFLRSKDPLHSVFVWGKGTNEIVNLDGSSSLGVGSIFDWMHQSKAKMVCIDVHFQNSLTYVHFVEEQRKVNYRKAYHWKIKRLFQEGEDEKEFVFYSRQPWVLTDLELLQQQAIERGVATVYQLGNVRMLYFDILEMHQLIETLLDEGKKLHKISLQHFAKGIVKKILGRT